MTSTPDINSTAVAQDCLDQVRLTMDEEQMQKFMALLDAPPVDKPKLAKLMSTPSPWDQKTVQR
jgi:uncharacterized protein (DUF1778 family)